MTNREMIEQMMEDINSMSERNAHYYEKENDKLVQREAFADCKAIAEELVREGWVKIPEDAVVLTKEEYNDYINLKELLDKGYFTSENRVAIHKARKETAREILKWLIDTGVIFTAPDTIKMYFKEHFGVEAV